MMVNKKSKKAMIPNELMEKGNILSRELNIPRTRSLGILSEGCSMPTRMVIKKMPRSKKTKVICIWEREYEI